MTKTIIKNGLLISNNSIMQGDLLIENGIITKVGGILQAEGNIEEIDAEGKWVMPGVIDDQVHFREPGLTHKAEIFTESRAALAGGVTSYMEMPNTNPPAVSIEELEKKYQTAEQRSWTNYSFFMGTTNDNYDALMAADYSKICGIKIFMGSSTGDMLVDNEDVLEKIFANSPALIATHCEDEATVKERNKRYTEKTGEKLDASYHPIIRNEKACLLSSSMAANLARKHNTRLHILHITTQEELALFDNDIPLEQKRITSEVCVHHLWFTADDYELLGNKIKCNPAIKSNDHAPALMKALLDGRLDVVATDHAPHTLEEKSRPYSQAPAGLPLVQHSLAMMLQWVHKGIFEPQFLVEKMCHHPAICFGVEKRGFLNEGYYADIAIVDPNASWEVNKDNILYKCGWSPLEGQHLKGKVIHTLINGHHVYNNGVFTEPGKGMRLQFSKK